MAEAAYRRLPGRGLRREGLVAFTRTSCRLYLGNDHLLCIDSTGYTESYRRFYYTDIQALQIRKTTRGKTWSLVLASFAASAALIALALTGAWAIALWSTAGVFLLFLLINVARGPTCVAQLQTAVHVEQLPSLNRLRVAEKAIARLRPQIEQAQGTVAPEQLAANAGAAGERTVTPTLGQPTATRATAHSGAPLTSSYQGSLHRMLFSFLFLDAVESVVALFIRHVGLALVSALLMGIMVVLTVAALVRQQGSGLRLLAKRVTWATMIYLAASFLVGNVLHMLISMKDPNLANDQWRAMQAFAQLSPFESPWYLALLLVSMITSFCLGVLGLIGLRPPPKAAPIPAAIAPEAAETPAPSGPIVP